MGSIAQLKSESRHLDFDVRRESRTNKQQQQRAQDQRPQHFFEIHNDEAEDQLLQELKYAEERGLIMSSASGSSSTSSEGTSAPTQVAHNPMEALQSSLASGKFSDLTITHGNQSWSAHRVVVCSQSSVLESMIMAAESPNILRLDKYDYEAVSMMMEYLYGSNYTTQDSAPHFSLPLHISIFNLAVDLSIPGLKSLAVLKFRYNLNNYVNEPTIFFAAVRSIYETTTRENPELRLATLDAGISELRNMLNGPHKPGFFRLTQEVPDFQAEIYLLMLENPTRPMEVMAPELCQECGPREEGDGYEVTTECKHYGFTTLTRR